MSLTARDRAVMRDMARLMEGAPFGEGKIFWDQTPQGALYWDEVYCNLLSLANPPEEDVSKERKTKLVFYLGGPKAKAGYCYWVTADRLSALVIAANHLLAMLKAEAEEGDKQ